MNNNFDEKYIIELVKKELSKYLTEQGIEMKKQISFLGDDKDIEEKQEQICQNLGFRLEGHTMILYGICPKCQNM